MRGPIAAAMSTATLVALLYGLHASRQPSEDDTQHDASRDQQSTATIGPMPTQSPSTTAVASPSPEPSTAIAPPFVRDDPGQRQQNRTGERPPPQGIVGGNPGAVPIDSGLPPVVTLTRGAPKPTATRTTRPQPTATTRGSTYTGQPVMTQWGPVQVQVVYDGRRITTIRMVQRPGGLRASELINGNALPILVDQAMATQSAMVDTISGATLTSNAFATSLQSALDQARRG